jgi:DNA-binding CsgD family transcriptional regulator
MVFVSFSRSRGIGGLSGTRAVGAILSKRVSDLSKGMRLQLANKPDRHFHRVFVIDRKTNRLIGVYDLEETKVPPIAAVVGVAVYATSHHVRPEDILFLREDDNRSCQEFRQQCREAAETMRAGSPVGEVMLTPREQEVLNGIAVDKSNKEIAVDLCLSERTVKFHVSSLLQKYHVQRRGSLITLVITGAVEQKSVEPELEEDLNLEKVEAT